MNLNNYLIRNTDGVDQVLKDFSAESNGIRVFFRDIEENLIKEIRSVV
jgi:hypothetical protein